jgi:hypothetical protein
MDSSSIIFLLIILLGVIIYFIPAINAYSKKKANASAVLTLNLFLGWTLIGWIVALVWSSTEDGKPQIVVTSHRSSVEELEKLVVLKEKGVLTEEEFQAKKKKLLEA